MKYDQEKEKHEKKQEERNWTRKNKKEIGSRKLQEVKRIKRRKRTKKEKERQEKGKRRIKGREQESNGKKDDGTEAEKRGRIVAEITRR